jgi:hypothetical protein
MAILTRLVAVVSLVLVSLFTFTLTTVAFDVRSLSGSAILGKPDGGGGGGSLPAAGNYRSSSVFAGFFACCVGPNGTMQVSVNVSHTTSVSNPLVGPTTTTDEVDVQFNVNDFTSGLFASGCVIPQSSDFTVNSSGTLATLNTTVLATSPTCQGQSVVGVTPPFTLNATWTVSGPIGSSSRVDKYSCASYTSESQSSGGGSSNAVASFSASFLAAAIPQIAGADVFSNTQFIHAQGTPASGCIGFGGKGAGPGPQAPGNYTTASVSASMSVQPDDTTQQPFSVFVTSFTNTAHPVGAPISTQTETDLNVFQFSFFQFVRDCWIIPASDLSVASDLHTATLNVAIDIATPSCPFADNTGLPASFTISAMWTPTSPLANFSNTTQGGCGSSHSAGTQQGSGLTATATGAWPGIAASFTDTNAFLSTNSSSLHIQGTSSGC